MIKSQSGMKDRQKTENYDISMFEDQNLSPIKASQQQRKRDLSPSGRRYLSPTLPLRVKQKTKRTVADDGVASNQQVLSDSNSCGPSNGSTIYEENGTNRYYSIVSLTTKQNDNLKQQNEYLVSKLKKMKQREQKIQRIYVKAKQYKAMYLDSLTQIQMLHQQCEVYRKQAEQMKQIALRDAYSISQKVLTHNSDSSQQQSERQEEEEYGDKGTPEFYAKGKRGKITKNQQQQCN